MAELSERVIKSTQEQAVAAWITNLNQIRLDELISRLDQQDVNLAEALGELAELKNFIGDPLHILGNPTTKHGEIAEHVQVNFSNARRLIQGLDREYTFDGVGRTAPEDYLKNGLQIQSKFCNGIRATLTKVREHLENYPDFVENGGSYDIPKDQYNEIIRIINLKETNPTILNKTERNVIETIKKFEEETGLSIFDDLNASVADYKEVQQGVINNTIAKEETEIKKEDERQREEAYHNSKPTLKEGVKAVGVSAALEGGVTFCMSIAAKRKEGKKLSEFTEDDWKDIGIESGKGTLKGGIRGGAVYILSNFTATPANVASAYVTAAFGVASQAKALERGEISKEDFVINCEAVCLDVAVSAIASIAGQIIIPIPILGAVVGNVAGEFMYEICKKQAGMRSQEIIAGYYKEMEQLNQQLDIKYVKVVLEIERLLKRFTDLEKLAFDEDINKAFLASATLAIESGVDESQILKTKADIDDFFLN
ncbi:MAG: hypothetical protein E7252_10335 [Lachnospira sp.]|nr:hypothetical protein [Lachnospira sp.]